MADVLSEAQQKLMAFINDPAAARALGSTLAEIAVELMDAKQEALHWKKSFETVRDEIKVLASVAIHKGPPASPCLVITKADFAKVEGLELQVDSSEPGIRVYRLLTPSRVAKAVGQILATH
jgi:hypothetical protein